MPLYFFNVHDGRDILDDVGSEFPSDDDARAEAARASAELLKDVARGEFWTGEVWTMRVLDQDSREVATLRFSGEMHKPGRTPAPTSA